MATLPTGTVTFLFTDIEKSTQLWEQYPELARAALVRHDALIEEIVGRYHGDVVRPRGEGDSRFAVFSLATDAVAAAAAVLQALHAEPWATPTPLRVRMALHTGEADLREGDYYGSAVNRCARLRSAAHGGQTLLSEVTHGLVQDALPTGVQLVDMGEHRLKDLTRPEHIFQLVVSGLPSEFPPLKTLSNRPNNLPLQPTSLIGRKKESAEVEKLLKREEVRLVTLTGPGGTGKTRLGLQLAAEMLEDFDDGVWFVDLSLLKDPGPVMATIAAVLDVKEVAGQPLFDTIKAYLNDKTLFLLLDSFEQVTDAAPQMGQLLASCPRLKVLATSRVPLRIRGEREYAVPPLSVPDVRRLPPLERLTQYEAVRLFIERATDVRPDFEVTNENAPAVAQICVRLDGLPLAIELAAARIRMLSPDALLSRLSQGLRVLTGGARDLPARQQTLRNTIEWSYDLLDEGEKQLFRRMAPFIGGSSLEALEAVCNYDGQLAMDVFEGTESLLSKNLLRQAGGSGGEPRFWMLETIHEYASEKLEESGESGPLGREHALHFMSLAEKAAPELTGKKQAEWLNRLEEEHDNLRAALRWAKEAGEAGSVEDVEIGLRTLAAIWHFWQTRGYFSEGRKEAEALLAAVEVAENAGQPDKRDATAGARANPRAKAGALNALGNMAYRQGDYSAARTAFEEALDIGREVGDKWRMGFSLAHLGILGWSQGDYPAARSMLEEALALSKEIGDRNGITVSLINLGIVAYLQGDYPAARSMLEEALALSKEIGDRNGIAWSLHNLGNVAYLQGDYPASRSLLAECLVLCRELGQKWGIASTLGGLGVVEGALAVEIGVGQAGGEEGTGGVEQARSGAILLGAAEGLRVAIGAVLGPEDRIPYERGVASIRSVLGDDAFETAMAEGRAMSLEEAMEYALQES